MHGEPLPGLSHCIAREMVSDDLHHGRCTSLALAGPGLYLPLASWVCSEELCEPTPGRRIRLRRAYVLLRTS